MSEAAGGRAASPGQAKRVALLGLVISICLLGVAYASAFLPGDPPTWAAWLMAIGTTLSLIAMMAVGAARQGRIGRRLAVALAAVLAVVGGGFGVLLALPPAGGEAPLWLGLPPRAAVLLYGIGLVPFFIVPVVYAWTFDELTLSEADMERVREARGG